MIRSYGPAIAGILLAGLGPAFAEPGPRERQCMVGERRVDGECRPLSQGSGGRGDQGNTGNRGDAGR
jgi:hypothetical protein